MKYKVRSFDGKTFDTPEPVDYVAIVSESDEEEYAASFGSLKTAKSMLFVNFDRVHSVSIHTVEEAA